jgi:hypothetical protein
MTDAGSVAEHAQTSVHLLQLFDVFPSSSAEIAGIAEAVSDYKAADDAEAMSDVTQKNLTGVESMGLQDPGNSDDQVDSAKLLG